MSTFGLSRETRLWPARAVLGRPVLPDWTRRGALQLAVVTTASATIGVLVGVTGGWKLPAAVAAMVALTALGLLRPRLFMALFILARPMVALISSKPLVHGLASANANGLTGLLLFVVLAGLLVGSRPIFTPRATGAFVLLLAASALAAVLGMLTLGGKVGANPLSELVRLASLLAMYLLAANLFASVKRTQLLLRLIALSAVAPAIFGVIQWVTGAAPFQAQLGVSRISSTLGGSTNSLAAYLAPCALVVIAGRTGLPRWVRWPSLALILTALVGTYSREGWLIFLLGIVVVGWRRQRRLVVAVLAGTLLLTLTVPAIHDRLLPSGSTNSVQSGTAYTSFQWRLQNWSGLVKKFEQNPLVGYGLGTEQRVNPYLDAHTPGLGWPSHNSLLTILIEGGVMLLLFWVGLFSALLRTCASLARRAWELQQAATLALGLWITVIAAGLITEDALNETTLIFIVIALTGSLEGARRSQRARAGRVEARA